MNRAEFFSQVKKDILQTMKEIVYPFIDDDIEKINKVIDDFSGYKWFYLGQYDLEKITDIEDKYINNRTISIYYNGKELTAFDKACPKCNSLIQWISYEKKFKCMQCDKEFMLQVKESYLELKTYKLKNENKDWYIAMKNPN